MAVIHYYVKLRFYFTASDPDPLYRVEIFFIHGPQVYYRKMKLSKNKLNIKRFILNEIRNNKLGGKNKYKGYAFFYNGKSILKS
jgi:hypothetical protein